MIPSIQIAAKQPKRSASASKGYQPKWSINGYWYKADSVGYEAFAEVLASRIAHMLNINMPIVDYSLCNLVLPRRTELGCCSASFLSSGDIERTVHSLMETQYGTAFMQNKFDTISSSEKLYSVVNVLSQISSHLVDQLSCLFQFDRLVKNGDRHLFNIVLRRGSGSVSLVLFDNGDSCTSDITYDYPEGKTLQECLSVNSAKPLLVSFDTNCNLVQKYSSFRLCAVSNTLLISDLSEYVPAWFFNRVVAFLKYQFQFYLGIDLVLI